MPSLAWTLVILTAINLISAVPTPWEPNTAYSGSGGHATGGSVIDESTTDVIQRLLAALRINIGSNNAGNGGHGTSGLSSAAAASRVVRREKGITSYSGAGGEANGGTFDGIIGLINIGSNNGGNAGTADSGPSVAGVLARQNEYEPTHQ
ncbi:hypothetical protein APHAL10511_006537 [Amanita phalloides]|nr:hypothetical protein APHAL10511_006537 [Amanita phalloides]